ncbi:LysR family transcriptional regulator [Nocardia pseudobrasiliensis]|uniref:DNA-binding transcriptional LysR family regulator n=1 Tax=Nocardia pseudobrasiliensis TaxID=45979 RepID=A0A370HXZ0_9NOCA|nr:LysR family transcriptional regulator [Nocardia pseudobrasiliensis]RDI63365.1 DNA-binding transcriptional LysR family regulator [Nocardia pseudobrasiliensis]
MEIRHLRYFLAVAHELNFTRAAQALQMSVPPLSQRIRALERELGRPLFDRSTHHTRLTPAGETLLPIAERLVADFDAVPGLLRASESPALVRIAVPDVLNPGLREQISRIKRTLATDYRIESRQLPSRDMEAELLADRVDIAFCRAPITHPDLTATELSTESMAVILDARHFPGRKFLRTKDLRGFTCVPPPRRWTLPPGAVQVLIDAGVRPDSGLTFSDIGGLLLLLTDTRRFAIMAPESDAAQQIDPNAFAVLPLIDVDMRLTTQLVRRTADTWLIPVIDAYPTETTTR